MDERILEQAPKVTVKMPNGKTLKLGGKPKEPNQGGDMKDPEPD